MPTYSTYCVKASHHPQFASHEAHNADNTSFISCLSIRLRYIGLKVRLRSSMVKERSIPLALSKAWQEKYSKNFG